LLRKEIYRFRIGGFHWGSKMSKSFCVFVFLLLCAVISQIACSPAKIPKAIVKGEVKLNGKAMADGEISFVFGGEPPETLMISNGTFSGEITIGEKRVEIRAYREGKIPETATLKEPIKENYIPERFNSASTLKATVSESGVEPSKFDVTSE
jgi:hypothetical protein